MRRFEHGGDVWHGDPSEWLDFSSNINALGCPGFVRDAMKAALCEVGYYPQVSMRSAACGLSAMLSVPEGCVLPTNGGIGAIDLAIMKTKPTRVVSISPAFVEYERIAAVNGIEYKTISMLKDRHTASFPLDELEKTLQCSDMLIICNPSNPIGCSIDRDMLMQVLMLTKQRSATLLVDEAFADFCEGLSLRNLTEDFKQLIIAGSLTKMFAIPGVRIGYLLANSDTISALKDFQTPWVLSAFANRIAAAVGSSQAFIKQTVIQTVKERDRLKTSMEKLGLFVYDGCANYLLADLKPVGIKTATLSERLREYHILVRDCENYDGLDAYHMRVAVKNEAENEVLVRHIADILKGQK